MSNTHGQVDIAILLEQTGWLHALARGLVGDSHRAEELTQDTLLAAVERPPRGATERPALRAWLARVARNLAFSSARGDRHRAAREESVARTEQLPSVAEAVERTELRQRLTDAVLELSSPYREVVILRYLEGLSTAQVAERTGASAPAVRTRLSRGLSMLRARLDEEYGNNRKTWMAIVLPLAGEGKPLAAGGGAAVSGLSVAKVFAGLVAAAAAVILAWAVIGQLDPTGPEPAPVEVEGSGLAAHEGVHELREPFATGQLRALDAKQEPTREAVEQQARGEARTIECREVLDSGHPDSPGVRRYKSGEEELVLGPPRAFTLGNATPCTDRMGYPAVSLYLIEEEHAPFGEWTAEMVDRPIAFVVDDEVVSVAVVRSPLGGTFMLEGQFTPADVRELLAGLGFPLPKFDAYTFHGVVVAAADGTPIEAPRLSVSDRATAHRVLEDGHFQVEVGSRETETILVEADGYTPATVVLSRGHGTQATATIVDLVKTAGLEVRVVDGEGTPVAGALVRLSADRSRSGLRPRWSPNWMSVRPGHLRDSESVTTELGQVRREELPARTSIQLELFGSREASRGRGSLLLSRDVVLAPGERRSIELALPVLRTLSGRVIGPGGEGIPDVAVQLARNDQGFLVSASPSADWRTSSSTTSNAQGRFTFEGVPEGLCQLSTAVGRTITDEKGTWLAAPSISFVLDEATSSGEVIIEMLPARPIGGIVVDAEGEPVRGVTVMLRPEAQETLLYERTDEAGEFLFGPLPPGRYALGTDTGPVFSASARLATAGERAVRLRHVPCTVTVEVDGVEDLRDSGLEASLYSTSSSDWPSTRFDQVEEDRLQGVDIAPGTYSLVLRSPDGRVGLATGVELGLEKRQVDLSLELGPGVPLEIRLDGETDRGTYEVRLGQALVAVGWVRKGLPDVQLVPPGSLRVQLLDESGAVLATKGIEAAVGREARPGIA